MTSYLDWTSLTEFAHRSILLVGSGPANVAIAETLLDAGEKVLMIEGGESSFSQESQDSYRGSSTGEYHLPYGLDGSRMRFMGGSSNCWAGGCTLFSAFDFQPRNWIPKSGWPITFDDLSPYYDSACDFFGIDRMFLEPKKDPQFQGFERCNLVFCEVGSTRTKLSVFQRSNNFKLLLGFSIFDITFNGNKVEAAGFCNLSGEKVYLKPKILILGCGGIENARILLNVAERLNKEAPFGKALGKYFADHPIAPLGTIIPSTADAGELFEQFDARGIDAKSSSPVRYFFRVSDRDQENNRISNVALQIIGDQAGLNEVQRAAVELRNLINNNAVDRRTLDLVYKVLKNPVDVLTAFIERSLQRGERLSVRFQIEQTPNEGSYIRLSDDVDVFGLRRSVLNWKMSDIERRSVNHAAAIFASRIQEAGLGTIILDPFYLESKKGLPSDLRGGQHHSGTTRMGADESESVVNRNCRLHNVANLYLIGSSVFPTNSWANPTLTIVALAKKLAEHLKSLES